MSRMYDDDDADFDGHVDEEVEDETVQWVRRSYDNGDDDDGQFYNVAGEAM